MTPEAGGGDYRGLDPERILAQQGALWRRMAEPALRRRFMAIWANRQEKLCHNHAPGMTPDLLRILYHAPALVHSDQALIRTSFVVSLLGSYLDGEFIFPDHGHWN